MPDLTGDDLRQAFDAATSALERHRNAINALNVFPVPDGDTGTNMLLTMRSAMEKCPRRDDATVAQVTADLAEGAFWGARGNSGVILSQFFKGFAEASKDRTTFGASDLARALGEATDAAYRSVGTPVEGTMLTVIRALFEAVQDEVARPRADGPRALWETAFLAGKEALNRTPSQLPVLQEAGVVDAGGMGMVVIMGEALCQLTGQDHAQVDLVVAGGYVDSAAADRAGVDKGYLDSIEETYWGYCTQFVIMGEGLVPEIIRHEFAAMSDSAVVVGDGRHVRVHIHALDPGPSLSYGTSLGQLSQIEVQNMSQQKLEFVDGHRATAGSDALAVLAVVPGDGLAGLFREAGCAVVVSGGQTMNPSVRELLDAAETAGAEEAIILPNNKNVVPAAEQAAATNPRLHVVPSSTVPQGVTALLAFNPEESLEHNLKAMNAALAGIVSIEVTQAVRPTTIGDLTVAAGQYIGLLEGDLVAAGESIGRQRGSTGQPDRAAATPGRAGRGGGANRRGIQPDNRRSAPRPCRRRGVPRRAWRRASCGPAPAPPAAACRSRRRRGAPAPASAGPRPIAPIHKPNRSGARPGSARRRFRPGTR